MDPALLEKCADPALSPSIVEQFVAAAGSNDPLAITVTQGGRLVLIPKPRSPDEAVEIVREHVGHAVVRVGLTQFPAGLGVEESSRIQADIFDPCQNLLVGTTLFAKIARIVTTWYGHPTNKDLLPQMLDDTIFAWRFGRFEGDNVFQASDPGGATFFKGSQLDQSADIGPSKRDPGNASTGRAGIPDGVVDAGIRIDLSRIGELK